MNKVQIVTGGTIQIFHKGGNMNNLGDLYTSLTEDPNLAGTYRGTSLDEGEYFLVAKSTGRGTVVKQFKLPQATTQDELQQVMNQVIGPINMVAGVEVVPVTVENSAFAAITTGITVAIADIWGVHEGAGVYNVGDVPVGSQTLEIIPDDPDTYQNLKVSQSISDTMDALTITLYPPFTLQVNLFSKRSADGLSAPDTTSTLWLVDNDGTKITQFTRSGNTHSLLRMSDGDYKVQAFAPDNETPRSSAVEYNGLSYATSTTGVTTKTYTWINEDSLVALIGDDPVASR